jgi:hypothetical protein
MLKLGDAEVKMYLNYVNGLYGMFVWKKCGNVEKRTRTGTDWK